MTVPKDRKKFWLAVAAGFVALNILEYVLNGVLLRDIYMRPHYLALWNPEAVMRSRMWAMYLAYAAAMFFFVRIYTYGYESGRPPLAQGAHFGFMAGALIASLYALINYMVYPVSLRLAGAWLVGGVVNYTVVGAVVGLLYRPRGT